LVDSSPASDSASSDGEEKGKELLEEFVMKGDGKGWDMSTPRGERKRGHRPRIFPASALTVKAPGPSNPDRVA
jgi:hypothetical protein